MFDRDFADELFWRYQDGEMTPSEREEFEIQLEENAALAEEHRNFFRRWSDVERALGAVDISEKGNREMREILAQKIRETRRAQTLTDEVLWNYKDGLLSPEESEEVERQLSTNCECEQRLNQFLQLQDMVKRSFVRDDLALPDDRDQMIREALAREMSSSGILLASSRTRVISIWGAVASIAAAVVLWFALVGPKEPDRSSLSSVKEPTKNASSSSEKDNSSEKTPKKEKTDLSTPENDRKVAHKIEPRQTPDIPPVVEKKPSEKKPEIVDSKPREKPIRHEVKIAYKKPDDKEKNPALQKGGKKSIITPLREKGNSEKTPLPKKNTSSPPSTSVAQKTSPPSPRSPSRKLAGDLNGDGKVDVVDNMLLAKKVLRAKKSMYRSSSSRAKGKTSMAKKADRGDINRDGKVDVADVMLLTKNILRQ